MKEVGIIGFVRVITTLSIIVIGITISPISMQSPIAAQAKVTMQDILYSGPRASMAASGNDIYITFWDNKTGDNEVYFGVSYDSGKSFNCYNLSNDKGASADSQIASVASNAHGRDNVYVTWWDNRTGNWEVLSRASNDSGITFGRAIMIKGIGSSPIKHLKAPPSSTTSVDTVVTTTSGNNNNEYVAWWDNTTGNFEVSFTKSNDGGKTFGGPVNISNSPDAHSVGASMVAQGNNVYIAWMDVKSDGQKLVMFRASNDNGETFGNPVVVYGANATAIAATPPNSSSSHNSTPTVASTT